MGRTALLACLLLAPPANASADAPAPDPRDLRAAGLVLKAHGALKEGALDGASAARALDLARGSRALAVFAAPLGNLLSLSRGKGKGGPAAVADGCSFEDSGAPAAQVFLDGVRRACGRLLLEALLREPPRGGLDGKVGDHVGKSARWLLEGSNKKLLVRLLGSLERGGRLHADLSAAVSGAYRRHGPELRPDPEVLSAIDADERLKSRAHARGVPPFGDGRRFGREFRRLEKSVRKRLEGGGASRARDLGLRLMDFHRQHGPLIPHASSRRALLGLAKEFDRKGDGETGRIMNDYVFRSSEGALREKAAFEMVFAPMRRGDHARAVKTVNDLGLLEDFESRSSRLQYWTALAAGRHGQKDLAALLHRKLVRTNPLSFYAVVSLKRHRPFGKGRPDVPEESPAPRSVASEPWLTREMEDAFARTALWIRHGAGDFIQAETDGVLRLLEAHADKVTDASFLSSRLAGMLNDKKRFLHAFQFTHALLGGGAVPLTRGLLKAVFPSPYLPEVRRLGKGIDPLLVLSLIRQESAFDPAAVSRAGARGLMQLMPATARRIRRGVGKRGLASPETNLAIGTAHLRRLIKRHKGDLVHVLAAYNAGEHRLKKWVRDVFPKGGGPLATIESIPFDETRNYVKLIYRNLYFYKYLHGEEGFLDKGLKESLTAGT